jgi:A/G-specific adenine glycosylase
MTHYFDYSPLKSWFIERKRDFPWRENPTPYRVWISEVMLQQTLAVVVIPYFERWMERFPSIESLASASLDEVIKLWEGLGYYSRARNLHEGARFILARYSGVFPEEPEKIGQIKGVGPYTVGAIRSFAFHQKTAAVDGNVMRLLTRYFAIENDIAKPKTQKELRLVAESILPEEEPWIINEAMIELGAVICAKKPRCTECPLRKSCASHIRGMTHKIPVKSSNPAILPLYREVAIISHEGKYLVHKVQKGKVMSGLHEFPYIASTPEGVNECAFAEKIEKEWKIEVIAEKGLPSVKHSFTRYRVTLRPVIFRAKSFRQIADMLWLEPEELLKRAFSSGHKRILQMIIG